MSSSTTVSLKSGDFNINVSTGLFINNDFVSSIEGSTLDVESPSTGTKIATIAAAGTKDVDSAVAAAKAAFPAWRATLPQEKARLLWKLAELIERDGQSIAQIEALDVGMSVVNSRQLTVGESINTLRYFAGWCDKITGKTLSIPGGKAYTTREPIGVCAAIVPWNAPFLISTWKLAPALAVGNVLILKTPELAPLSGLKLAELIKEAGFPPGVINVITGPGSITGAAISEHMEIRKVAFTGGGVTGRKILRAAASSNLKQVSLELGGKGPSIVFDDADLPNALFWTLLGFTVNSGQVCAAGSRIYVQEGIYDSYLTAFQKQLETMQAVGDPTSSGGNNMGPVISKLQQEKILGYIEKGKAEGGKILGGGNKLGDEGYFVEATAFTDVKPDATIMKEEIFGPVTAISKFTREDEVIAAANDTVYGLNSAIFTSDSERISRVTQALEAGTITVNAWGTLNSNTPFGGVKESGYGRDLGEEALSGWTNVKTVKQLDILAL